MAQTPRSETAPERKLSCSLKSGFIPAMAAPQFRTRFLLKTPTVAVCHGTERDSLLSVPANEEIVVLTPLDESTVPNRQVKVEWMGQELKMFAVDIQNHGERI